MIPTISIKIKPAEIHFLKTPEASKIPPPSSKTVIAQTHPMPNEKPLLSRKSANCPIVALAILTIECDKKIIASAILKRIKEALEVKNGKSFMA